LGNGVETEQPRDAFSSDQESAGAGVQAIEHIPRLTAFDQPTRDTLRAAFNP
jgi:hypothetical protein